MSLEFLSWNSSALPFFSSPTGRWPDVRLCRRRMRGQLPGWAWTCWRGGCFCFSLYFFWPSSGSWLAAI